MADFPETRWSQIVEVGRGESEPLEQLARQYWKPVYHYVRAMREVTAEDAEDVAQGFFAMLLRRVDFAALSPERGSFRAFLKTALRRFVISEERKAAARGARIFPFDQAEAEWLRVRDPGATPEEAFDREWARGAIAAMLERLRGETKPLDYDFFRAYCLEGEGSYEDLAKRHGVSLDDVRNGLRAVRQRGREILREMLRDTLLPGDDVETELRFVFSR